MKEIPLSQGFVTIVDDEDYEWLSQWKWCVKESNGRFYAVTTFGKRPNRKMIRMHRLIMGVDDEREVDHKNGNSLHNWRKNLRICTHSQNMKNRKMEVGNKSGYKGIYWNDRAKKYQVQISCDRKRKTLGYYSDPIEAAKVYDQAALLYHGEFACLNFPQE